MWKILGSLSFLLFTAVAFAGPAKPIDIVFDLDWTLVYTANPESVQADHRDIIEFESVSYRLSDYTVEVLAYLVQDPRFRVSIFSGGSKKRNEKILEVIEQKIRQRSGIIGGGSLFYKVLSLQDLRTRLQPDGQRFAQKFGKPLQAIEGVDLERAVLIDDVRAFAEKGQGENLLWIESTYEDLPDYKLKATRPHDAYLPADQMTWRLERQKLLWAMGVVLQAAEQSQSNEKSFRTNLVNIKNQLRQQGGSLNTTASAIGYIRKARAILSTGVAMRCEGVFAQ